VIGGGLGGKAVAEHFDPTVEEQHWRGNYERGRTISGA
jgi:hypothetical protein